MTKARSRSPREMAHVGDIVPFKSAVSYIKADVCELCGESYEIERLCPSCLNLRIHRIAYSVIIKMLTDGTLYKILTKGEEAIPAFDDYYELRDIYEDTD